jgi:beta-galactosidase/beta-glucuronidase
MLSTLDGELLQESSYPATSDSILLYCPKVKPWTCENPQRYLLTVKLVGKDGSILDTKAEKIGFRPLTPLKNEPNQPTESR